MTTDTDALQRQIAFFRAQLDGWPGSGWTR